MEKHCRADEARLVSISQAIISRMRILIATGIYPPEIGGPATYAALLAQELPKRGIEVDVLPFRTVRKYPRWIRHGVYFLKILFSLRSVDIIFTQDPISTGFAVMLAGMLSGKKTVLRIAGDQAWEQAQQQFGVTDSIDDFQNKSYGFKVGLFRFLQRWTTAHADVVITPSEYFNKLVSGWVPGKQVITVYNGIDLSGPVKEQPKSKKRTILSAGRLVPWKGFDTLVEALNELPEWELLIAGDGPDRERLQSLIAGYGLQDRVRLLGVIPNAGLLDMKAQANIFALLSSFESFSFQIVEAMHAGAPVIAADIGNISEIIENGKEGLLVPPNDPLAFIEAVKKISGDEALRSRLITHAKIKAAQFSIEKTVDRLVEVFNGLKRPSK